MRRSLLALLLLAGFASANPPVAMYVFPAGGQRGQTVEVRVGGLFLYDRCGFEMQGSGVEAVKELERTNTLWIEGPLLPLPDSQRQEDYPRDMAGTVKLAADAPLGGRHWRVWTSQGVTAARRFVVGDLPEIVEKELEGEPIPVPVSLPVTANGRIFPHEDVDLWSFAAKKGQTITCAVEAARLGSPLDARLEVLGPDGRSLTENDDAGGADPLVRFTAPADGTYQVRIHDVAFKGSQAHVYRLTLTAGPWVDRAYPLGGKRGSRTNFTLTGQGVASGPVAVDLPAQGSGEFVHRIDAAGQKSNPFVFDLDDLPETLEDDAKGNPEKGRGASFPGIANGRIAKVGEADRWSFDAKKGEAVEIELRAQRLGSPLQGVLAVTDATGKALARAEVATGDPSTRFTAPADGTYTVEVRDRFRSRGGPAFAYRLRLYRPGVPDFRLRLATDAVTILRGGQANLRVQVERLNGFKDPITLALDGLPSDVTATGLTVSANQAQTEIVLKPAATSAIRTFAVTVRGTAGSGDKALVCTASLPGESAVPPLETVRVAVAMPTPFKVVGKYDMGWATRGSVGRRMFNIERGGYDGPLTVSLTDRQARHLQGVTGTTITVPPGATEFEYSVQLPPWMEIGRTCRVCVMAVGVVKDADGSEHTVSFSSVNQNEQYVAVVEAGRLDLLLQLPSVRAEAGKTIEVPLRVVRGKDLQGPVKVELIVPAHVRGVTASATTVPANQEKGTLSIRITGEGPGPFNMPLLVRATLTDGKDPVTAEAKLALSPP